MARSVKGSGIFQQTEDDGIDLTMVLFFLSPSLTLINGNNNCSACVICTSLVVPVFIELF